LAELELELELELLGGLGLISRLLLPSTGQSDPLSGVDGCGECCLHLLSNDGQSGLRGGGAGCGHFLLPRQELY
jgi:hypothetical protein